MTYLYCPRLIKLSSSSVDVWLLLGRHQDQDGLVDIFLLHPKARVKKKQIKKTLIIKWYTFYINKCNKKNSKWPHLDKIIKLQKLWIYQFTLLELIKKNYKMHVQLWSIIHREADWPRRNFPNVIQKYWNLIGYTERTGPPHYHIWGSVEKLLLTAHANRYSYKMTTCYVFNVLKRHYSSNVV